MKPSSALALINFFHSLISSALAILLPLYLLQKSFKIEEIGIIFSVLPIVFLFTRTILASLGDMIGNRLIFKINGISSILSVMAYLTANTSFVFGFGKFLEGIRQSSFWAVIRTEVYNASEKGKENHMASFMLGVRYLGDLFGKVLIGALLIYISFYNSLLCLLLISFILLYLNLKIKSSEPKTQFNLKEFLNQIFHKRSNDFWKNSAIISLISFQDALSSSGFVFPIYFSTVLKMSYFEIGAFLALYSLFYSLAILSTVRFNLSFKFTAILAILLGAIPFFFAGSFDKNSIYLFIIAISLGAGFMGHLFEAVLASLKRNSKFISTDIALAHVPIRITEFLALISFGFLIASFGYSTVFNIGGISIILFTFGTYFILRTLH